MPPIATLFFFFFFFKSINYFMSEWLSHAMHHASRQFRARKADMHEQVQEPFRVADRQYIGRSVDIFEIILSCGQPIGRQLALEVRVHH